MVLLTWQRCTSLGIILKHALLWGFILKKTLFWDKARIERGILSGGDHTKVSVSVKKYSIERILSDKIMRIVSISWVCVKLKNIT